MMFLPKLLIAFLAANMAHVLASPVTNEIDARELILDEEIIETCTFSRRPLKSRNIGELNQRTDNDMLI
ncbi:hypothetical protein G7054_g2288 [Neopestalotiopsis clavispora]|nr:hypothetical protein G7054_g2288 [Neopestalotiopsis clavispora]